MDQEKRLLVVDDEPAILKLVQAMLAKAGYSVITCETATEALRLLNLTPFDCVITDALMPVMNGYDLTNAVRRHPIHSSIPVLMLTRKRNRNDVKHAMDVGVTDYVLKPVDEQLLLDKVGLCVKKGEGKRHVYEMPVTGIQGNCRLQWEGRITHISEADMTIRSTIEWQPGSEPAVSGLLFDELGLSAPILKVIKSEHVSDPDGLGRSFYRTRLVFVGLSETDLMKIRSWIQRKSVRQLS